MLLTHNINYLILCGVRFSSSATLWLDFILIFTTLTFIFDAPPQTLALAASLYGIPALLLGPYLGSLADRLDARQIIFAGFCIRFAAACSLFSAPSMDYFLIFTTLKGISNLGTTAAEVVLTQKLLLPSQIVKNTSVVSIMDQTLKISAPLAAGLLTGLSTKPIGFLISAGFCVIGLVLVARLPPPDKTPIAVAPTAPKYRIRLGLEYFHKYLIAQVFLYCVLLQSAALGLYDSLLGLLLKEHGYDSASFGLVVSATALGGILAGFAFPHLYSLQSRRCATVASFLFGLAILMAGLIGVFPQWFALTPMSVLFLLAGFAYGLTSQGLTTTLQLTCSTNHLGAIFATTRTLSIFLFISFPVLGGWLAGLFGTAAVIITAGAATIVSACALHFRFRDRQSTDTKTKRSPSST